MPLRRVLIVAAVALGLLPATTVAAEWSPAVPLGEAAAADARPEVAVDYDGAAIAVWRGLDGGQPVIRAAIRPEDGVWGPAEAISGAGATQPQVIWTDAGAMVAWVRPDEDGTARVEARERTYEGAWSAPTQLSPDGGAATDPALSLDGDARVNVAWSRHDGTAFQVQATARDEETGAWSPPADLSSGPADSRGVRLAFGPGDGLHAAWLRAGEVESAFRPGTGAWSPMQPRSAVGVTASGIALSSDYAGAAVLAWSGCTGAGCRVQTARSDRNALAPTWSEPVDLSELSPAVADVRLDSYGASALWQQQTGSDLLLQGAAFATTGGWSAAAGPPGVNPLGTPFAPQLGSDYDDVSTAVWARPIGADVQIETTQRPLGGVWSPAHVLAGPAANGAPALGVNSDGAAAMAWTRREESGTFQAWVRVRASERTDYDYGDGWRDDSEWDDDRYDRDRRAARAMIARVVPRADGSLVVKVTVNQPGRVAATARSRLGRKRVEPVVVAGAAKRATRPATVRLVLTPESRRARHRLRAAGRLEARLKVVFTARAGGRPATATKAVVFKKPKTTR